MRIVNRLIGYLHYLVNFWPVRIRQNFLSSFLMAAPAATLRSTEVEPESAIALLTRAVSARLQGRIDTSLADAFENGPDWRAVVDLAFYNRIINVFVAALRQHAIKPPPAFEAELERYRAEAFRMNARNLMTTSMAASALKAAGIEAIAFKGPAQQQQLYGDPYVKPSGDVDLLVSRGQYDQAFKLFQDTHALDPNSASPWWRIFLGEQTLRSRDGRFTTIDLHYRLQQPGCPSPRDIGGFLGRRKTETVGVAKLPVPSAQDTCLIICLNVVKGLIHREPSGAHVIDLMASLGRLSDEEIAQFVKLARREGLFATVLLSVQIARATFGFQEARLGIAQDILPVPDAELAAMTLAPDDEKTRWAKRRSILWALCGRRPLVFAKEAAWAFAGELCRRYTQPTSPNGAVKLAN